MRKNRVRIAVLITSILVWFNLLFTLTPVLAQNNLTPGELLNNTTIQPAIGLATTDIRVTIARIIRAAMGFIGIGMVAMLVYGGFTYMTSGGNEEQAGMGKKVIAAGIIGLVIVLSAYAISNFVITQLVNATA